MRSAVTFVEVLIVLSVLAIIAAITIPILLENKRDASGLQSRVRVDGGLDVREWVDLKTGKRYLVFTVLNGVAVIEAPLVVEARK